MTDVTHRAPGPSRSPARKGAPAPGWTLPGNAPQRGANRGALHTGLCRTIVEYLRLRGAWVFKVHGHLGQQPGVPDILGCFPPSGRLVGVEVKTGNAKQTAPQHDQAAQIRRAGGLVIIAHSLEDVEDALLSEKMIMQPSLLWRRRGGHE